jgi:hypothetical protein
LNFCGVGEDRKNGENKNGVTSDKYYIGRRLAGV